MSPMILGLAAAALVTVLVAFYGITQSMEARREEKRRLCGILLARADHFQELLTAFPPNFLPADIRQLVGASLLESWRQLRTLDPQNSRYHKASADCEKTVKAIQHCKETARQPMDNPAVIKEARAHLKTLGQYLQQQMDSGKLSGQQAQQFSAQLRQLQLTLSLDGYNIAIRQANQSQQYSVAAHNCEMAKKTLMKESASAQQAQMVQHYQQLNEQFLLKAQQQIAGIDPNATSTTAESPPTTDGTAAASTADNTDTPTGQAGRKKTAVKKHNYD
jgi:hypothetical protein